MEIAICYRLWLCLYIRFVTENSHLLTILKYLETYFQSTVVNAVPMESLYNVE